MSFMPKEHANDTAMLPFMARNKNIGSGLQTEGFTSKVISKRKGSSKKIFECKGSISKYHKSEEPQVPCYFIFGDSLVDSGNNNQLMTASKVNYPPYGIDFSEKASGRFTNGRTSADLIGEHLGFDEYIPTYAVATDEQINKGVNYASGSAGIREETGSHLVTTIYHEISTTNFIFKFSRYEDLRYNHLFKEQPLILTNSLNTQ
ncbi:GDSL esterase/lipase-like protein [Tanacetum coccineum]